MERPDPTRKVQEDREDWIEVDPVDPKQGLPLQSEMTLGWWPWVVLTGLAGAACLAAGDPLLSLVFCALAAFGLVMLWRDAED